MAEAQLRVVVADSEVTPLGTVTLPNKFTIDDNGAIAFVADVDGNQAVLVWRNGVLASLAKPGDPVPCGGGTISGIGDGLGGLESVALRGLWAVFDIYDSTGTVRRLGSNDGTLRCMASVGDATSQGALAAFQRHPVTNEAGEVLVDDSRLWLVPNAGGSYGQIAGAGTTVPVPPQHTAGRAVYWALDDDGDATVVIETSYLGGTRQHALHGRPGAMTLIEPLGIDAADTWTITGTNGPAVGVSRDGIVAYEAFIETATPTPYFGVWIGAPGATTRAIQFPADGGGGITLTSLFSRPHVIGGSHFVAEMKVESAGPPRQALVRWNGGTLSVLATTGAALPGHPTVMVERFGGVGVDGAGTIFVQVHTGTVTGGIYRIPDGGAIEKILVTGDTLSIAGVDETIRGTRFETTHGTGYGSAVSVPGGIVFTATYQMGAKIALVTTGGTEGPSPDLVLEILDITAYSEGLGDVANLVRMKITNVGAGASLMPLLSGLPGDRVACGMGTMYLDQGQGGRCILLGGRLDPGASVEGTLLFDAPGDPYAFTVEAFSDGQDDADPSNNLVTGTIDRGLKHEEEGCACGTSGGSPLGLLPLASSLLFVLRRRRVVRCRSRASCDVSSSPRMVHRRCVDHERRRWLGDEARRA